MLFKFLFAVRRTLSFLERQSDLIKKKGPPVYQKDCKGKVQEEGAGRLLIPHMPQFWVRHIIDGDTVVVGGFWHEIRVRLDSIDCPEDGQYWGDKARYGLIKLIGGRRIRMEEHGVDGYGRTLATLYVFQENKWVNVNERMIALGHAWVMHRFCDHLPMERQDNLNRLERWARSRNVGLWHQDNPIPPWEWRRPQEEREWHGKSPHASANAVIQSLNKIKKN